MNVERYRKLIDGFGEKRILVIGDVMLDRFIWGGVSRISPEAPVPVVRVREESTYPGGAANVARNLIPFSHSVDMVGLLGRDGNGEVLLDALRKGGIGTGGMVVADDYETITKTRVIARQQQVVRFDHERPVLTSPEQVAKVAEFVEGAAGNLDGLIIEDYGKGFVTQELVDAIVPLAASRDLVVTVDPNAENRLDWQGVTAVKPNRSEAFREAGVPEPSEIDVSGADPAQDPVLLEVGEILMGRWGAKLLQVTLGEQGMMLFERGQPPHHIPTKAKAVFDVSGAGDTAIALFTLALAVGASAVEAAEISNYASGVVVGKLGTATLARDELLEAIERG
ncbi:MAG: bifunctional heptose 7-phosphate kinase/heptose 1-phosphate adenyltransferase [Verrucomicrobiales bacterium]